MQKFAFLRTWPYSKHILDKGHVLRNANFCIQRQIKNFTQNDLPNLLLVCTTTYVCIGVDVTGFPRAALPVERL